MDEMDELHGPVLVGYDGSPIADAALRYAVDLAHELHAELRVVVARGDLYSLSAWADEWTRGLAEEWVAQARTVLDALGPRAAAAKIRIRNGLTSEVLLEEAVDAGVLVVGAPGHSLAGVLLEGSVSQHLCRHAPRPVVVVRPAEEPSATRIVVGVDGSEQSLKALRFALRFALGLAAVRGSDVMALHAEEILHPYVGLGAVTQDELGDLVARESSRIEAQAAEVAAGFPTVGFGFQSAYGRPAAALVTASSTAALVVVGSVGRGAFRALLLGSVGAAVLHHAHCPVAVIR